jgi:hypothetical protein
LRTDGLLELKLEELREAYEWDLFL